MAKQRKRKTGKQRWNELSTDEDIHIVEYHGRKSAWDSLHKFQEPELEKFISLYMNSLGNKNIHARAGFVEGMLRKHKYRTFEEISNGQPIESIMGENPTRIKSRQKYYIKFQKSFITAIQIGRRPITDGTHIAAAHLDSVNLIGRINKLKQDFNIAYMLATPYGGLDPKDFLNIPMSMYIHAIVTRKNQDFSIHTCIGEEDGEPKIYFPEQSFHLEEDSAKPKVKHLRGVLGNRPYYDKKFDPTKRMVLNVMDILNKKYGITERSLKIADIRFVPSIRPSLSLDGSVVAAYGQDNWASAFALLHGFLNTKNPEYTKIAIFYDREEVKDSGMGSISSNFFSEIITPTLAYVVNRDLADHYTMLQKGWGLFLDGLEPIHAFEPSAHDPYDSSYLGSGISITPASGETGDFEGYKTSPEYLRRLERILEENRIPYQYGVMGTHDDLTAGSTNTLFQSLFLEDGASIGVPCIGMHRATEQTSAIDLFNLTRAVRAFYSVKDHGAYAIGKK